MAGAPRRRRRRVRDLSATGAGVRALAHRARRASRSARTHGPAEATAAGADAGRRSEPRGRSEPTTRRRRGLAEHIVFRPAAERGFPSSAPESARSRCAGAGIERLLARYDLDNEEAMAYLEGGCGGSA